MNHELESAVKAALKQMPKDEVEAIIQKALAPPVPVGPHRANILHYASPIEDRRGFRATFSFRCAAGKQHTETAHHLWTGENYLVEIRDISCGCSDELTQVELVHPNQQR